jgi:uncharacterized metal-binding protein
MSIINNQVGTDVLHFYLQGQVPDLGHVLIIVAVMIAAVITGIAWAIRSSMTRDFKIVMPSHLSRTMAEMFQAAVPRVRLTLKRPDLRCRDLTDGIIRQIMDIEFTGFYNAYVQAMMNRLMDRQIAAQPIIIPEWIYKDEPALIPIGHGHIAGSWSHIMKDVRDMTYSGYDMWSVS